MMTIQVFALLMSLLAQQLPAPFATPWYRKGPRIVAMPDGHKLTLAEGFNVTVFADGLQMPRFMAIAPNGDVFVTESMMSGRVTVLRDADHDGVAETKATFAEGLTRPFGIAFWKDYLYIGN